jgi:hypothetical protein
VPLPIGHGRGTAARPSRSPSGRVRVFTPLERSRCTRRALAIADASIPTYFDFKNGLAATLVFNHVDIAELKTHRLVWAEACIR